MHSVDSNIMRKLLGRGSSTAVNETAATATSAATEAAASAAQQQQPAPSDNPWTFISSTAGPNTAAGISNLVLTAAAGAHSSQQQQQQQQQPQQPQLIRSRNASYSAAAPILSLDASPDGRHLVLAGRHILRTVNATGSGFSEDVDLRAIITSQKGGKASGISDQLSIQDVKWQNDHSLFTACASGKIFYYDLAQARGGSVAPLTIQNNTRQVTTLDVNPHHRSWLISGSQDGAVRIWDMRTNPRTNKLTFNARQSLQAHSESIRCVRWSPRDGFMFACSTDNGMVFYGDIRMPKFRMRISAHEGACSSISWHPDGVHLLTGGIDQKLHVWDMTSTEKRRKPEWVIHTPAPVGQALWRPSLWSAADQGRRAAQIAVAYDASSQRRHGRSMVHIWDLARPTLPFKVLEQFSSTPTGLLWRDQDVLWAVGQDGELNQCDLALAPRVIDRQAMSTFAFSPTGDTMMFLDKRPGMPRHHHMYFDQPADAYNMRKHNLGAQTPSISMASSPQGSSLVAGRSYSDEDLTGTFLNQRRPLSSQKHDNSNSNNSNNHNNSQMHMNAGRPESCPPVIAPHQDDSAMPLAKSMEASGIFCMTQSMATSTIPFSTDPEMYKYLTFHYLTILQKLLPRDHEHAKPLPHRVGRILEQYGQVAEDAGLFRLAQSWRILGHVTRILLQSRGQFHLQLRMGQLRRAVSKVQLNASNTSNSNSNSNSSSTPVRRAQIAEPAVRDMFPRKPREGSTAPAHSLLAEEIENTSNMTTPRAHAVPDGKLAHEFSAGAIPLSPVLEAPSSFALPPAMKHLPLSSSPRVRHNSQPLSTDSRNSSDTQASTDGYDFYDAAAFTKAIDVPGAEDKSDPFTHEFGSRTPGSVAGAFGTPGHMASSGSYSQSHPDNILSTSMSSRNAESEDHDGDSEYHSHANSSEIRRPKKQVFDLHDGDGDHDNESPDDVFVTQAMASDSRRLRSATAHGQNFTSSLSDAGTVEMARQPVTTVAEAAAITTAAVAATTSITTAATATTTAAVRASPHVSFLAKQLEPTALEKAQTSDSLSVGEYDYFLWHDDPPFPFPSAGAATDNDATPPIDPYAIIQKTLEFESRKSAVNAAAMVLLLRPLVPESVISKFQAEAVLKQHHSRLMNMKCFIEAAQLRNLCTENWVAGLPCWGESYPSIFGTAQHDVQVSFACPFCRKPREISPHAGPDAIWACERCQRTMAPCAVCHHRHVVADLLNQIKKDTPAGADLHEPVLTGWWYCRGCGHGGHANCLQAWHFPLEHNGHVDEFSNGLCPMDGCGHECLPPAYVEDPPKPPGSAMAAASSNSSFLALDKMFTGGGGGIGGIMGMGAGASSFTNLARTSQISNAMLSFGEGAARGKMPEDALAMMDGQLRETAAEHSQPVAVAEKKRSAGGGGGGGRGGRRRDRY